MFIHLTIKNSLKYHITAKKKHRDMIMFKLYKKYTGWHQSTFFTRKIF